MNESLSRYLHDLNNRIAMILANAELLQLEQLSPKARDRSRIIEQKALEVREIIQEMGDRYMKAD